jgi:small-conductance mechanosensitive channel
MAEGIASMRGSAAGHARALCRAALLALLLVACAWAIPEQAQAQTQAPQTQPAAVQDFLRLLEDPAVQSWLRSQRDGSPPATARAQAPLSTLEHDVAQGAGLIAERIAEIRRHVAGLALATTELGNQAKRLGDMLAPELARLGLVAILALFLVSIGAGMAAEWVFWRLSGGFRKRIIARQLDTTADRVQAVAMRFAFGLGWVATFATGSIGAFLVLPWPPLLRMIALTYLQVLLIVRLTRVLGRFLFAPGAARFRLIPMSDAAARHWHGWTAALIGWFAFGRLTVELLKGLGSPAPVIGLFVAAAALIWLALALVAIWNRPPRHEADPAASRAVSWGVSAYLVLLWLSLLGGAPRLFWLGAVAAATPAVLTLVRQSVAALLRDTSGAGRTEAPGSMMELCLERGLRAVVLIGAIMFVARLFDIDLASLATRETAAQRMMAGALNAFIIVLLADFLWHAAKVAIEKRVASAAASADLDEDELRRRARIRTLMPILRNILFVFLGTMTALMALSQLGVEIGPLIAGAGVLGVAIGFGAQTLVRDVISGIFYLLDDAFRVGEYIQSSSYKGTVESFSLRSVKLRHHRGPLYTVPFGSLGAIQNMSRDWVIDKVKIGVTYDSDIDLAKKLVKQVGRELLEDAEFRPNIIETLKMQGVETLGDYAIELRLKMKTKPGEQFTIRRRALALIKKSFDAHGIKFAFPVVQVAGGSGAGEAASAAAARHMLDHAQQKPAAAG